MRMMTMTTPPRPSMLSIPVIYAIVSGTWIATSDYLLNLLPAVQSLQTIKGLLFVVVTTFLLQRLTARNDARIDEYILRLTEGERLRVIGELAARLSHDLRNVLMAANAMLTVLNKFTLECPQAQTTARQLHATLKRGAAMLSEVLGFAAQRPAVRERIALGEWLSSFVEEVATIVKENVIITASVTPADLVIAADTTQLHRLLTNLVMNASDAIAGHGTIAVNCATAEPSAVAIVVRDTGSGMPADIAKQAFEPLFSTKAKGTGLGLAIVADIAGAHGGFVTCESTPDHGSAFRVVLPHSVVPSLVSG